MLYLFFLLEFGKNYCMKINFFQLKKVTHQEKVNLQSELARKTSEAQTRLFGEIHEKLEAERNETSANRWSKRRNSKMLIY